MYTSVILWCYADYLYRWKMEETDATYVNILKFIRNMLLGIELIPTLAFFGTSNDFGTSIDLEA